MATGETCAQYVAMSNTVIGLAPLAAGSGGLLTGRLGLAGVIALLGVVSPGGAVYGLKLKDVGG